MTYKTFLRSKAVTAPATGFEPNELPDARTCKPIYIYGLTDPDTGELRYVGKSIRPKERLLNHMNEKSNCHRSHWLQSLKSAGKKPDLIIIEEIIGHWPWQESERFWIRYALRHGCRLINNTSGGDGVCNLPPETRQRMALVWKGRKHTPETIEKLKAARALYIHSDETKAKIGAAHKGRKITWIDKISDANRKLTREQCEQVIERRRNGELNQDLAVEFGVHRTTLSKIQKGKYFR